MAVLLYQYTTTAATIGRVQGMKCHVKHLVVNIAIFKYTVSVVISSTLFAVIASVETVVNQ